MNTSGKKLGAGLLMGGLASLLIGLSPPVRAATFSVDSTADAPDKTPGDAICADSEGRCTLRAAIMEANAVGGSNTIDLSLISDPATPIILSIPGADETVSGDSTSGYTVTSAHDASKGDLNITSSMSIVGAGAGKTVIEWDPSVKQNPANGDRVFHIEAVSSNIDVSISGVTIENGVTPAAEVLHTDSDGSYYQFERWGGGIAIGPGAAVTLIEPSTSGSEGGSGSSEGGAGSGGSEEGESTSAVNSVTLSGVQILDNQSGTAGGGISNAAPLTLDGVLVSGNTATTNGGGIYNQGALTVKNSTIGTMTGFTNPNSAGDGGGGIYDTGLHNTSISESAIVGNKAVDGGGVSSGSIVTMSISNTTIEGNSASNVGAGMTTGGTVTLKNDTIADNKAANSSTSGGAGLNAFGSGTYNFVNTLFQKNVATSAGTAASCGCSSGSSCQTGALATGGHNLADDQTCSLNASAGDLPDTSAQLQALAGNGGPTESMALLKGTPAVDAGDNANCPSVDQRGNMRPADGNLSGKMQCDIGAYELFTGTNDLHASANRVQARVRRGQSTGIGFDFTNDPGASADATGVTITTDPLPQGFALSSATLTTSAGKSNCAFDANTQVASCDVGTLARGDTASLDLQGTGTQPGALSFTAHIAAAAPVDLFPDNNTMTVTTFVQGNSNIEVTASGPGQSPQVNGQAPVSFTVKNLGPDQANGVKLLARFQNRMAYKSMTTSSGAACTVGSDKSYATCDLGNLASGDSVTGTLNLQPTATGAAAVELQVTTDDYDEDVSNNTATVPLTVAAATPTAPTPASSSGGGGCTYQPGGPMDPALLALLGMAAAGLGIGRWRRRTR